MDFFTFKRKRKNKVNEEIISLSDKVLRSLDAKVIGTDTVTITDECRPDKLAMKWYGNKTKDWIILKFNHISNPFSIKRNFKYKIPDANDIESQAGLISNELTLMPLEDIKYNTLIPTVYTETGKNINKQLLSKQFGIDPIKVLYNKKKLVTDKNNKNGINIGVTIINDKMIFSDNPPASNIDETIINNNLNDNLNDNLNNNLNDNSPTANADITLTNNIENLPNICSENCDNTDPEICKLCKCKPKLSDVLIYKILNS